ncbi:MAG TPA: MFS transporter, partial [Patescibacteria group bacterium]|nr:MFS transporter [Patescibacteria group bacterium]
STVAEEVPVLTKKVLAAIAATFLLMGLLFSSYGPLLAYLSQRFAVSLPVAGEVFSAHFGGSLLGVLGLMRYMHRVPNRQVFGGGLVLLAAGLALIAVAPAWLFLLAAIFLTGIGFGILALGLNQIVAHGSGSGATATLNLLGGTFALGAVLGPILAASLGAHHFSLLFGAMAVLALALVPQGFRMQGSLPASSTGPVRRPPGLVPIFVLAFALYVGTEAGTGGWAASHLVSVGVDVSTAAALTSGFWLALGLGRVLAAVLLSRVPEWAIVTAAAAIGSLSLLLAVSGQAAPVAYIVTGAALAPIFPTGLSWLAKLLPGDAAATSWIFPGTTVGGALLPAGVGLVIASIGVGAAPLVLSALALATFLAFAGAGLIARRASAVAAGKEIRQTSQ